MLVPITRFVFVETLPTNYPLVYLYDQQLGVYVVVPSQFWKELKSVVFFEEIKNEKGKGKVS